MKYHLIAPFLFIFFSLSANISNEVPNIVKVSFATLYPQIETPHWEFRGKQVVALFNDELGFKKAFFHRNGEWIETRERLSMAELPQTVQTFYSKNYEPGEVTFIGKVISATGSWYRIETEYPLQLILTNIDHEGKILNEEIIPFNFLNQIPRRIPEKTQPPSSSRSIYTL